MLYLVLRLRGMISTFTTRSNGSPAHEFLFGRRGVSPELLRELRTKAEMTYAKSGDPVYHLDDNANVLAPDTVEVLKRFLDFMWRKRGTRGMVDMRLAFRTAMSSSRCFLGAAWTARPSIGRCWACISVMQKSRSG